MLRRKALLFAAFLFVALSVPALSAQAQRVVETTSKSKMMDLMKDQGYNVKLDDDGDILWKLDGVSTYMFVADDGESIQFYTKFNTEDVPMEKINAWNRDKRYSRTYIDKKGFPVLELDLDFAGGITEKRIIDFINTCKASLSRWQSEVL